MSLVAFILGAGTHVGLVVANRFKQKGYRVAIESRKPIQEGLVAINVDVSNTDSITKAFAEVKEKLGFAPNVIIFNGLPRLITSDRGISQLAHYHLPLHSAYALTFPTVPGDPSTVELSAIKASIDITAALYASMQQAVAGFRSLPAGNSVPRTFIFAGDMLPLLPRDVPLSAYLNLRLQMVDGAYLVEIFYIAHAKEGSRYGFLHSLRIRCSLTCSRSCGRFHYGNESKPDGSPAGEDWSGTAHAAAYWNAISREERGDWYLKFGPGGELLPQ